MNQVHGPGSHGPPASLNRGHRLLDGRLGFNPSEGVCGFYSRPLIFECAAPGAPADHGRRHREGSPELRQPAATKLSFLWGFALRDRGDEAAGVDRAARAELSDIGGSLRWFSGDKNEMSRLPTFPSCLLTTPIASRDDKRSNSRVT
jgi:hypothetical protein